MATSNRANPTLRKLGEAEAAFRRLEEALAGVGVVLPSLRVDLGSCTGISGPLLELGGCNLATAERLAEALTDRPGER